jgi:high-affinity iron transporter
MACERKSRCTPGTKCVGRILTRHQCCSPLENGDGGWGIFNSLFGWQNSATYGSVISYNLYWLVVIAGFGYLGWKESKDSGADVREDALSETSAHGELAGKKTSTEGVQVGTNVREISA